MTQNKDLKVKLGTKKEAHLTQIKEGLDNEKMQIEINKRINEYLTPFIEKLIEEEKQNNKV